MDIVPIKVAGETTLQPLKVGREAADTTEVFEKKKSKSNFPRARGNKASDGQLITRRLETSWTKRMLQCIPKSQQDVDYEVFLSRSQSRLKEKTLQVGGAGGETMIQSQKLNQSW